MTLILSGTDGLSDIDGSAATPAIRGTDTNTGIFFPAADTMAVATGGTESARFISTGALQLPYGTSGAGVIRLNGTNYQSQGTTSSPETRAFIHTYRPLGTAQGGTAAFSTDGANSFVGAGAGNFTMAPENAAVGTYDIQCSYNAGFGTQALGSLTTGYNNVGIGVNAMRYTTQGFGNSSVGRDSMHEQTTGNNNSAFGRSSLYDITTGAYNTAIGSTTGHGITTGNNNTIVGARVTGLSSSLSGAVIVAAGDGTPYVDIQPSGGNDSLIDVPSANTTAYNGSATDGQIGAGATLLLRSNVSSANFVSQIVFLARAGQPYNRIVSSGSTTPFMAFCTNNAERARIDSSGNVGIGTSSPSTYVANGGLALFNNYGTSSTALAISNNSGFSASNIARIDFRVNNSFGGNERIAAIWGINPNAGSNNGGALVFGVSANGTATTPSEVARIDSSGNLQVGSTSFGSGTTSSRLGAGNLAIRCNVSTTYEVCNWLNSNGQVGTISLNGTSTSYNTSSDYRLKHDITPMTGALAKVAALKPVTYKWNADNSAGEGFIAHELAEVVPQCVTGEKDAVETYTDEEGNEQTRPKYQGIDTSFLVATLTAAIQEQQAIIQSLTARIEALEGK